MLLYAIYTPQKIDSWHQQREFAFASIESFIHAINDWHGATLKPVTRDFLMERRISLASLIRWNPETKECEEAGAVNVSANAMYNSWDGKLVEIHLVERAADENVLKETVYA